MRDCGTRTKHGSLLRAVLFCAPLLSGCFASVASRCPACTELAPPTLRQLPPQARRLFVLIPGLLGYGHEWNAAQIELVQHPEIAVVVYSWEPWRSVVRSGQALAQVLDQVDRALPAQIRDVTVIAHSAAGMIAVEAAARISEPLRRPFRIVAVGTPLAGMGFYPDPPNLRNTPLPMVLGGRFTEWPSPRRGIRIDVFPTGPDDPVMRPIGRHDPADPRVLPAGSRFERLPAELGHNNALGWLCRRLLSEDANGSSPPIDASSRKEALQ